MEHNIPRGMRNLKKRVVTGLTGTLLGILLSLCFSSEVKADANPTIETPAVPVEFTYDGAYHDLRSPAEASVGAYIVYQITDSDGNDVDPVRTVDACNCTVEYWAQDNNDYNNKSDHYFYSARIKPRPITFTGKSESKPYTGNEITINTLLIGGSGLVSGHTHNVVFEASGTTPGAHVGIITAPNAVVIMSGNNIVTGNYNISVVNGTLTIQDTSEPNRDNDDPESDHGSGEPEVEKPYDYLDELRAKIAEAILLGGEQTVTWDKGTALPYDIMKTLEDNPQITLVFSYTYLDKDYKVTIPGSKVKTNILIPHYGPLYLFENYGMYSLPSSVSG